MDAHLPAIIVLAYFGTGIIVARATYAMEFKPGLRDKNPIAHLLVGSSWPLLLVSLFWIVLIRSTPPSTDKRKMQPSAIRKLLDEIADLEKAKDLLESVYSDIGPYQDGEVSFDTWNKVRNYFKFDDSE